MWCSTCALDTVTIDTVTADIARGDLGLAAEKAEAAHRAHDGAHEPNWHPGDAGDNIFATHYHLTVTPDDPTGAGTHDTDMHRDVSARSDCHGDDYRAAATALHHAITDVSEELVCDLGFGRSCESRTCTGCAGERIVQREYRQRVDEAPAALLAETDYTFRVPFGTRCDVRVALTRVPATDCTHTTPTHTSTTAPGKDTPTT